MKNLTRQNPGQLFVAQELINKVKSKFCGIKDIDKSANTVVTKETDNRDVDIMQKAIMMIDFATKAAGMTNENAINQIMKSEPFCNSPKLEVELKKYYLQCL